MSDVDWMALVLICQSLINMVGSVLLAYIRGKYGPKEIVQNGSAKDFTPRS